MTKKRKPTKAELEAEAAFVKLNAKWDRMYGPLTKRTLRPAEMPVLTNPPGRERQVFPSRTTPGGSTATKVMPSYSGTAIKGVALMHKSNYAPVMNEEDAIAIARMRR